MATKPDVKFNSPEERDAEASRPLRGLGSGQLAGAAAGAATGAAAGAATAATGATAGPSIQLNLSVLNRIKWIKSARTNKNIAKATKVLRGSKINQSLHMIPPPYTRNVVMVADATWTASFSMA